MLQTAARSAGSAVCRMSPASKKSSHLCISTEFGDGIVLAPAIGHDRLGASCAARSHTGCIRPRTRTVGDRNPISRCRQEIFDTRTLGTEQGKTTGPRNHSPGRDEPDCNEPVGVQIIRTNGRKMMTLAINAASWCGSAVRVRLGWTCAKHTGHARRCELRSGHRPGSAQSEAGRLADAAWQLPGLGYSQLEQINKGNVKNLQLCGLA